MATRILVVEDDPMNAKLFQLILTRAAQFEVEVTEDPAHVVAQARSGGADLIIMDVSLSNSLWDGVPVDGLEICRRLKSDPETKRVPILLATAHAMKGDAERLIRESGADAYIAKPIGDPQGFVAKVEACARRTTTGAK